MERWGGAAIVACAALAVACSRDDRPRTIEIKPRFDPGSGAVAAPSPTDPEAPAAVSGPTTDASALLLATVDAQPPPYRIPVTPPTTPSSPASAAAPPPDPDIPLKEQLRVAEGGCFASLRAGPRLGPPSHFARVDVTVVPTGSVSRAEIGSTDVTDDSVLECLRSTALAARFADNDGGPLRTYSIDVRVVAH